MFHKPNDRYLIVHLIVGGLLCGFYLPTPSTVAKDYHCPPARLSLSHKASLLRDILLNSWFLLWNLLQTLSDH